MPFYLSDASKVGSVPEVTERNALTILECVLMLQVSKAACILTTQPLMRILRSREAAASVNIKTWPTIIDTGAVDV